MPSHTTPFVHFSAVGSADYCMYIGKHTINWSAAMSPNFDRPSWWNGSLVTRRWFAFSNGHGGGWYFGSFFKGKSAEQAWTTSWALSDTLLHQFIFRHRDDDLRAVFGPRDNCAVWCRNHRAAYATNVTIHNKLNKAPVEWATLGVDGTYYIRYQGGSESSDVYDLNGRYRKLREILRLLGRPKVEFLALHPYDPEQFFLVLRRPDGTKVVNAYVWSARLREALREVMKKDGIEYEWVGPGQGHRSGEVTITKETVEYDWYKKKPRETVLSFDEVETSYSYESSR